MQFASRIVGENSYPDTTKDGKSCKFNKTKVDMTISGYAILMERDEELLKEVVASCGFNRCESSRIGVLRWWCLQVSIMRECSR